MYSIKELAAAYECHRVTIKKQLKEIGIDHRGRLDTYELSKFIRKKGVPRNKEYHYLVDLVVLNTKQLQLFQ